MPDKQDNQRDAFTSRIPKEISSASQKQRLPLLVVFVVFIGFVTFVFLTQRKDTIEWVEDYEQGLKQARQQNKPVLLAFYKLHTRFCTLMTQNTYNDPDVKEYVEENFVPILIDVDKQSEIAKEFNIAYYPTHYVKYPDSDKLVGPQMGYDVPQQFIKILQGFLEKLRTDDQ